MVWPKGKPFSAAHREKIGAAGKGQPKGAEHREKIGAAHRGRPNPGAADHFVEYWRTHPRTPEMREKMAAPRRGRRASDEHRANISAALRSSEAAHQQQQASVRRLQEPEIRAKRAASLKRWWASLAADERDDRVARSLWKAARASQLARPSSLEVAVAREFEAMGLRVIAQEQISAMTVDFLLPDHGAVVEVDGCYWHGCASCGYPDQGRRAADQRRTIILKRLGYRVFRVREHHVKQGADAIRARLADL